MAGHEEPFRRGSWPSFAFDDFFPPHTGPYLGLQELRRGRCRVAKRWELNTVLIVNTNNRTTVGLANNTGQQ